MTETERKALALVNEVLAENSLHNAPFICLPTAVHNLVLIRAIEQHEAFRQEVSEAVADAMDDWSDDPCGGAIALANLKRFILPKPDPLVEALEEASGTNDPVEWANRFYAAIEKRGGKIVWGEG